jgi:hypothetical protein
MTGKAQIIKPGRSLVEAAAAIDNPRRALGKYPYQWLFPGPNSRHVLANGQLVLPAIGGTGLVVNYMVPDGLRFSLRAVVFAFEGTGWNEGTATGLSFTLLVQAAGPRNVDFLQNILTHLGSTDQPYPILGRLEFAPRDTLQVLVTNNGVATGPSNVAVAHLVGHTYPASEVVG